MDAQKRRKNLLNKMSSLKEKKIGCFECEGNCCTFQLNSMHITPLEAFDLIFYLNNESRVSETLINELKQNALDYRLDIDPPSNGGRNFMRRTYTCPFFKKESLGCTISPKFKPYGCLGFNPTTIDSPDNTNCHSDQTLLEERELLDSDEKSRNLEIKKNFDINWNKKPIPTALLDILKNHKLDKIMKYYS